MSAHGVQAATVQEISGGRHGQTYMGGQFGQYIGTQVNKTYNPVGVSGKPHNEGEFQVGCLITVHENCPISLSSRIFNATLHSGVTGDRKAAVKITPAEKTNYREAKVHFSVPHHKNIVERIATDTFNFRGQPSIFIAMELCDCNLYDHIQSEKKDNIPFDVEKYIWFAYQILQDLAFLHLYQVVHGDLKPPNVLLKGNVIKLSDFGLSKPISSGKDSTILTSPQAGTLGWQAPEILKGAQKISTATDIFPAGLVLYYIFSHGEHAYGVELYSLSHNIANGINQDLSNMQIPNSNIAEPLVRQMLESDPAMRPTAEQALENKIFNSFGSNPSKVTDSRLHEIVNNAVEDIQSRASQVRKNQSINDAEEVIPLGVTLAQLSNAMNVVFEEKKINVFGEKQATDTELQEIVEKAVKRMDGQGGKLRNDEAIGDEKTPLGFTVDQLANTMKELQLMKKPSEDQQATNTELQEIVDKAVERMEGQKVRNDEETGDEKTSLSFTVEQLSDAMMQVYKKKKLCLPESQDISDETVSVGKHLTNKELQEMNDKAMEQLEGQTVEDQDITGVDETLLSTETAEHTNSEKQLQLEKEPLELDASKKKKDRPGKLAKELKALKIYIEASNGKIITYRGTPVDTIERIKRWMEVNKKVPTKRQTLLIDHVILEDYRTLHELNIRSGATIHLYSTGEIKILVQLPTTKRAQTLEVKTSNTVREVKQLINRKMRIPIKELGLIYAGEVLNNDSTLAYYNIQMFSTLWVFTLIESGMQQIFIRNMSGKTIPYGVELFETIEDVKKRISEKEGLLVDQQRLTYQGRTLENGRTLQSYGIRKESTLRLYCRF